VLSGKPPPVAAHGKVKAKGDKKAKKAGKGDKKAGAGKWVQVYKSEIVEKNLNPQWKPFTVFLGPLCNDNIDQEFLLECFDYDPGKPGDLIGYLSTTIRQIQQGTPPLKLVNPKRIGLSNVSGTIKCLKCEVAKPGGAPGGAPGAAPAGHAPPPAGAPAPHH